MVKHPMYEKLRTMIWKITRPSILERNGFKFYCTDSVPWYAQRMGRHVLPLIDDVITADTIFGDVGASFGFYSLYCAPKVKRVYSYEINPERIAHVHANIQLNKLKNIQLILNHCPGGWENVM